jgi:hypothetical protein
MNDKRPSFIIEIEKQQIAIAAKIVKVVNGKPGQPRKWQSLGALVTAYDELGKASAAWSRICLHLV